MEYCVYFIKVIDEDIFKVGYTGEIKKRLSTIQTGNGYKIKLYRTILVKDKISAIALEKYIKTIIPKWYYKNTLQQSKTLSGEWYNTSTRTVDMILFELLQGRREPIINKWIK